MRIGLALVLAASCGGRTLWPGDPDLYGVELVVSPDAAPWASAADAKPRLHNIVDSTAGYFGFDPAGLSGLRVVLQGSPVRCGSVLDAFGCWESGDNTATIQTDGWFCLEVTAIEHELLHVFLGGDAEHKDPRWANLPTLREALICAPAHPECRRNYQCPG